MQTKKAKVFRNGASQAVRLPAEFRFDTAEVYVSRDNQSEDVILSKHPRAEAWDDFLHFVRGRVAPEDWMKDRPMNELPGKDRTGFDEVEE